MPKYESNNLKRYDQATGDEWWSGKTGGDVLRDVVTNPGDRMGKLRTEDILENLIDAVGKIADETGVNLLDVFKGKMRYQYRLNAEE